VQDVVEFPLELPAGCPLDDHSFFREFPSPLRFFCVKSVEYCETLFLGQNAWRMAVLGSFKVIEVDSPRESVGLFYLYHQGTYEDVIS